MKKQYTDMMIKQGKKSILVVTMALAAMFSALVAAEQEPAPEDCSQCVDTGQWLLGAAFGFGYLSSPIDTEEDILLPVIPRIAYYDERFFFDNLTLGYSLFENSSVSVDIIGEFNEDFIYFGDASPIQAAFVKFKRLNGQEVVMNVGDYDLAPRKASYLVGPNLRYQSDVLSAKLNIKQDVLGVHNGQEANAEISQHMTSGSWLVQHSAGITWKSNELLQYYYGLDEQESPTLLAQYSIESDAYHPYYKFNTQYLINESWRFLLAFQYEKLDLAITESPIIDQAHNTSFFIGVGYEF